MSADAGVAKLQKSVIVLVLLGAVPSGVPHRLCGTGGMTRRIRGHDEVLHIPRVGKRTAGVEDEAGEARDVRSLP
jgi:hypothetical protein